MAKITYKKPDGFDPVMGATNGNATMPMTDHTPTAQPTGTGPQTQKIIMTLKPPAKGSKPAKPIPKSARPSAVSKKSTERPSDSFAMEAPTTTRSGRSIAARKKQVDPGTVLGEEYEAVMGQQRRRGRKEDSDYVPLFSSSPYQDASQAFTKHVPTHIPRQTGSSPRVQENLSSSPTLDGEDPEEYAPLPNHGFRDDAFTAEIDPTIIKLADVLLAQPTIQTSLPSLEHPTSPDDELPWTSTHMTHLYIELYTRKAWNLCDMIADTWIRQFQRLSRRRHGFWRPNKWAWKYKDPDAKKWDLDVVDPKFDKSILTFDANLINSLYHHTLRRCGARNLWADAMALRGSEFEKDMTTPEAGKQAWHPDLIFNIMCTALRMTRRNLTLKIEETSEGVWCKRYHMHEHDSPCYRLLAKEEMEKATAKRGKRKADEMDDVEMSEANRASFVGTSG